MNDKEKQYYQSLSPEEKRFYDSLSQEEKDWYLDSAAIETNEFEGSDKGPPHQEINEIKKLFQENINQRKRLSNKLDFLGF